jgi:hypothetical protein
VNSTGSRKLVVDRLQRRCRGRARTRSPLVAVADDGTPLGAITLHGLLDRVMAP